MILRRLAQQLREQNWTAIFIEFVLLVLGVFLGIQVANWNADVESRRKGAEFTRKLREDLRMESWRYQFLLEYHRDVRQAAEDAAADIEGKAPLADADFLVNAYRATQYKQGASRRSTYDELVSTGNIGLIADDKLRSIAVRAYGLATIDNLVREGVQSPYREWYRMNVPTEVQRVLSAECGDKYIQPGDYTGFDHVIDYPCRPTLAPEVVAAAAGTLRADPQALRFLRLRIADLDTRIVDMTQNNRDTLEAMREIARDPR